MFRNIVLTLTLVLTVAGCARLAGSRLNPLNWFGRSQEVAVATDRSQLRPLVPAGPAGQVTDRRVLIDQITVLEIAPSPSGAIVRATGVAATQGYYNAQLVLVSAENGTLTYEFRVQAPTDFGLEGPVASRTISVATTLSATELAATRRVTVQGARNARTASR